MGILTDYLTGGKRHRQAREEYSEEYSSRSNRHITYSAYCRICGRETYSCLSTTPAAAIKHLQEHENNGCGKGNHLPEVREAN